MATISLKPVKKEFLGDLDTPVSLYLKIKPFLQEQNSPSFLLESVTGGEHVARYSFIGCLPMADFYRENGKTTVTLNGESKEVVGNPIDALRVLTHQFDLSSDQPDPSPFMGGAVGFFSWEIMSSIEAIEFKEKNGNPFPEAHFFFPSLLIVFDHVQRKISIIALAQSGKENEAERLLQEVERRIKEPIDSRKIELPRPAENVDEKQLASNISKDAFEETVEKAKHYIQEGDIFQVVLSQQFKVNSKKPPFEVYRSLRYVNPSPYMFYFDFNDYQLIGSSPEIMVKVDQGAATLRPLAGTRPRIIGREEELIKDLLSDLKERAEHVMLVDLGRNDLGRVCEFNSVETTKFMSIEKYSHVLHISSDVKGKLKENKDAFDLFKATFPAGTVSGAPKIRAMEIIEELEADKRGPYAGALGYIDFRGNMDMCILIRTALYRDKTYMIQAGAGIVADSVPENEYQETRNKAKGMILACL